LSPFFLHAIQLKQRTTTMELISVNKDSQMLAKTFYGMEEVLAEELRKLGAKDVKKLNRAVSFVGDLGFMYKANFCLRTALNISVPLFDFRFFNEEKYYKKMKSFDWTSLFDIDQTFKVDVVADESSFSNTHFAALLTKDAIVDCFREKTGKRPNVGKENPDIKIFVYAKEKDAIVYLDSSGDSLYKRGYKTEAFKAPINEVMAAGLIKLSGWHGRGNFLDPMCGSGTILCEAAMMVCNIPAGINRKNYSFMNWQNFDKELWDTIRGSAIDKIQDMPCQIFGFDIDADAIRQTKQNLANLFLEDKVEVIEMDFLESDSHDEPYFIISNPPYNKRIIADVEGLYSEIGNTLKNYYQGSKAWFISPETSIVKNIGLKPDKKIDLFQGKIPCKFVGYSMYSGSKKRK